MLKQRDDARVVPPHIFPWLRLMSPQNRTKTAVAGFPDGIVQSRLGLKGHISAQPCIFVFTGWVAGSRPLVCDLY